MKRLYKTKEYTFVTQKEEVKLFRNQSYSDSLTYLVCVEGGKSVGYFYYINKDLYYNSDTGEDMFVYVEVFENCDL